MELLSLVQKKNSCTFYSVVRDGMFFGNIADFQTSALAAQFVTGKS